MSRLSRLDSHPELNDRLQYGEEGILAAARTGDFSHIQMLLKDNEVKKSKLNINLKGTQKSNNGWTPLHLASYFGHTAIAELLIKYGANVNIINHTGDTPLHKATYTGREDIVFLLLSNNANVFIRNGEGFTARDLCQNKEINKQLHAAEKTDMLKKNHMLLQASQEGDTRVIEELLKDDYPLDVNCQDTLGNTALHCAAYRGKKEVAVLLLQNGIDPSLKNLRGQLAIDLAVNESMKQILSVQPVKQLQKNATRFEGPLLRKSRFLGWKEIWTVLEKGIMSFFISRADASTGTRRKGYKYLDAAQVLVDNNDVAAFLVKFSNNALQRYSVPLVSCQQLDRQKWVNAITDHIEFSRYYSKQGIVESDDDDDVIPLGTMQDKLQTAQAHQQLLERKIEQLKPVYDILVERVTPPDGKTSSNFPAQSWSRLPDELENLVELSQKVSSSLAHCFTVFSQQEEIRLLQHKQQQEQIRVLQDALHALAEEHFELEQSFVSPNRSPPRSPLGVNSDCDEFFDAFEGNYSPPEVALGHNNLQTFSTEPVAENETFFSSFSSSRSLSEHVNRPETTKWGRAVLPLPMFPKSDFSVWSILKQCIGKELSKITMPIIFNEPLSFLQRLSENMEYCNLLMLANSSDDPIERLEYVSAFAMAAISSNVDRLGKPFNPLLGETFELVREDFGFRIISEQVSHHPPVSAFHADSQHFVFSGAIHPKLKLWARSVEIKPEGTVTVKLLKHNEVYTWTGVNCCVHNIIVGKLWMEQCGTMEINCHTNGLYATINFKPAGWYGTDLNCVEGFICDRQKTKLRFLFGKWCSYLRSADMLYYKDYQNAQKINKVQNKGNNKESPTNSSSRNQNNSNAYVSLGDTEELNANVERLEDVPSELIWEAEPHQEFSSEYYNFTSFAMALNELKDEMTSNLPSTDSRLRPDIRKLEEADLDNAASEKHRLEEKQREVRKRRKKESSGWVPLWFECKPHEYAKEETWVYKDNYWDRNFSGCPEIF